MPKRDPESTARNKAIDELTAKLKELESDALRESGFTNILQLNAKYGGKFAHYIDIHNAVINSPDHFVGLYLQGFKAASEAYPTSAHRSNFDLLRNCPALQKYLLIFLRRVYLRNYEALSKKRPTIEEAAIWIGQNNADYGLLVTPRFNPTKGDWENDRSEIRHFDQIYWSIGHVLKTGLVVPGRNEIMPFQDVEEYLRFFRNVLVRNSGSQYEKAIAELYCQYVQASANPVAIPLLIPEFRYEGRAANHVYRLDYTIITSPDLNKFGFELSPWSTHGYLSRIRGLTQAEINQMAQDNFEREMRRHRDFFLRHGIFCLIYTDTDLANIARVFDDMKRHLLPVVRESQLRFDLMREIFASV